MAVISGTIRGVTNLSKSFSGVGSREAWLLTVDFAAYTASSDTSKIAAVGAAIDATARDGKSSTLRSGVCVWPGVTSTASPVYMSGASVQAFTVSSDDLTGEIGVTAAHTEADAAASVGMGVLVTVDRS